MRIVWSQIEIGDRIEVRTDGRPRYRARVVGLVDTQDQDLRPTVNVIGEDILIWNPQVHPGYPGFWRDDKVGRPQELRVWFHYGKTEIFRLDREDREAEACDAGA